LKETKAYIYTFKVFTNAHKYPRVYQRSIPGGEEGIF